MDTPWVILKSFIVISRPKPASGGVEVNPPTVFRSGGAGEDAGVERVASQQRQTKQRPQNQLSRGPHTVILDFVSYLRKPELQWC